MVQHGLAYSGLNASNGTVDNDTQATASWTSTSSSALDGFTASSTYKPASTTALEATASWTSTSSSALDAFTAASTYTPASTTASEATASWTSTSSSGRDSFTALSASTLASTTASATTSRISTSSLGDNSTAGGATSTVAPAATTSAGLPSATADWGNTSSLGPNASAYGLASTTAPTSTLIAVTATTSTATSSTATSSTATSSTATSSTATSSTATSVTATSSTATTSTATTSTATTSTATTSTVTSSTTNSSTTTSTTATFLAHPTGTSTTTRTATLSTTTATTSTSSSSTTRSTTTLTSTLSTTSTLEWPFCPARGCLPCPAHADGRPDCHCMEGYTLSGQPEVDGAGALLPQPLPWDLVDGWAATCSPVDCGAAPVLPHARQLDTGMPKAYRLRFASPTFYLCEAGYAAEPSARASSHFRNATAIGSAAQVDGDGLDAERVVELRCEADGTVSGAVGPHCLPRCGDGLLVPTEHLPIYDPREQCDDGNVASGDGCSAECRVEPGFVCTGGGPLQPDSCSRPGASLEAVLMLSVSGRRAPTAEELGGASAVAVAAAVGCLERDIEIVLVQSTTSANASDNTSVVNGSGRSLGPLYHGARLSAQVTFRAKASDPSSLSLPEIRGTLATPGVFLPRLELAFMDRTSLTDLYVRAVEVLLVSDGGALSVGEAERRRVREVLLAWITYVAPILAYIFCVGAVLPWFYWLNVIRRRRMRLMGSYSDIHPAFKGNWAFNICSCIERKVMLVSLFFLLPARMADTWDRIGLVPYWTGVRQAFCCCMLYLVGCIPCGACIGGRFRSNMRDFFGFGDKVKGNIELSDYCCYACCPLCCVVQEARHVDGAAASLAGSRDTYEGQEYDEEVASDLDPAGGRRGSPLAIAN